MKNMQAFYTQLTSSGDVLDRRLPVLTGINKARLAAVANEGTWFWWDAPQSIVTF